MHFPRFWAQATQDAVSCWRWSDTSQADAEQQAREAAARLAERFDRGDALRRYGYADRPLREPVLQEIQHADGTVAGVITRNAMGVQVLNSPESLFVDIDLPQPEPAAPASGGGLLGRLFGRKAPPPPVPGPNISPAEPAALEKIEAWTSRHPGWGWRIYRTRGGLRLLATHGVFDPAAAEVFSVFESLGADPLYRQLCRAQKSFRARLTPKPWRCGLRERPPAWPWLTGDAQQRFDSWEARYRAATGGHATCQLINSIGVTGVAPRVRGLLQVHDDMTGVGTSLPLA